MEHLSDFKPLGQVTLPGVGDLRCSGLVLIVGPNSSGKSQFLQDLFFRVSGQPRSLVVATNVLVSKPDFEPFTRCLEAEGYFSTFVDDNNTKHWKPQTTYLGTGQPVEQIQANQAQSWYSSYAPTPQVNSRRSDFLNYFGKFLVTALFLERRLTSSNQVGIIDFQNQPPQSDLHALYLDDTAREQLYNELLESFGKAVWPDTSRGSILCLRVSDEGVLPTPEDRLSPKKMSRYRSIETEGDGLKSYVATCVALLLGRRPVCLIDEPEMCLHPPQAYNLGRFIGKHGSSEETATFAATHSSQVLRGVIQTAENVQVVRLTRRQGQFCAHLVPAEVLAETMSKPTIRAESVLDGIFAQCVVVVEGDGDRLVYQTVWETLSDELRLDVHFAAVGGTGGIADTCNLYRKLNIPIAVIADLDLIADPAKVQRVLEVMSTDGDARVFGEQASSVMDHIKKLPPTVNPNEVHSALTAVIEMPMNWDGEDDIRIRRDLNRLSQRLDRMRKLKRGGIAAFSENEIIAARLKSLVESVKAYGVFLVPVGELEEWLANERIEESRGNKWAWANAAALRVQSIGPSSGDIWDFVRDVGVYLSGR